MECRKMDGKWEEVEEIRRIEETLGNGWEIGGSGEKWGNVGK